MVINHVTMLYKVGGALWHQSHTADPPIPSLGKNCKGGPNEAWSATAVIDFIHVNKF